MTRPALDASLTVTSVTRGNNHVGLFAANLGTGNISALSFTDNSNYAIGTINGIAGITATTITLSSRKGRRESANYLSR